MGTGPGTQEANEILIQAMADAEVPTYLPSEFGTNHYKLPDVYQHPILKMKRSIYEKSKAAGINTIRILCGDLLEGTFGPWFGFDNTAEVWTIVGSGDVQVAMTSMKDVGRFALEAVLLVHNGTFIPDELEVFSCQKTIKEYAAIFDSVAGTDTTLEFVDLQKAKEDYQNSQEFLDLLKVSLSFFIPAVCFYQLTMIKSVLSFFSFSLPREFMITQSPRETVFSIRVRSAGSFEPSRTMHRRRADGHTSNESIDA